MTACELCSGAGGTILWRSANCRVVRVEDPDYPGFCRIIWNSHVRDMTDLDAAARLEMISVVFAVEAVVRELFAPDKINLASLGNMTPHLHWHVIPRWRDDRHFPEPIWGRAQREPSAIRPKIEDQQLQAALARILDGKGQTPRENDNE